MAYEKGENLPTFGQTAGRPRIQFRRRRSVVNVRKGWAECCGAGGWSLAAVRASD